MTPLNQSRTMNNVKLFILLMKTTFCMSRRWHTIEIKLRNVNVIVLYIHIKNSWFHDHVSAFTSVALSNMADSLTYRATRQQNRFPTRKTGNKCIHPSATKYKPYRFQKSLQNGNFRWCIYVGANVHRQSCSKHGWIGEKDIGWVLRIAQFLSFLLMFEFWSITIEHI